MRHAVKQPPTKLTRLSSASK